MEAIGGIERRKKPEREDEGEKQEYLLFPNARQLCLLRRDTADREIARMHYGLREQRPRSQEESQSKLD